MSDTILSDSLYGPCILQNISKRFSLSSSPHFQERLFLGLLGFFGQITAQMEERAAVGCYKGRRSLLMGKRGQFSAGASPGYKSVQVSQPQEQLF